MAQWLSWLERRPVTAEVAGSSPAWVAHESKIVLMIISYGILAQLGEHLPYKQRVIGSSPIGSIQCRVICIYAFAGIDKCRRGGTGRRTGLKILRT